MMLPALLLLASTTSPIPQEQAFNPPAQCRREERGGATAVVVYLGGRSCVRFQAPRRFAGLWVNAFEGQRYVDRARVQSDVPDRGGETTWFSTDDHTEHREASGCPRQHVCRIVFLGRAAVDMHRGPLEGYGHMGLSNGLVLADRILSIEDLGPLRQR